MRCGGPGIADAGELKGRAVNFHEWWWTLFRHATVEVCHKIITIMWCLWHERNNDVEERNAQSMVDSEGELRTVWKKEMHNPRLIVRASLECVDDRRKARGITSIIRVGC